MNEDFSTLGFIKAIPGMLRKVWPGLWPLIAIISLALYFDSPAHLEVLSFEEWLNLHIIALVGMIATTTWLYNTFKRPVVNMAVAGLWFLATAACMMADLILQAR